MDVISTDMYRHYRYPGKYIRFIWAEVVEEKLYFKVVPCVRLYQ